MSGSNTRPSAHSSGVATPLKQDQYQSQRSGSANLPVISFSGHVKLSAASAAETGVHKISHPTSHSQPQDRTRKPGMGYIWAHRWTTSDQVHTPKNWNWKQSPGQPPHRNADGNELKVKAPRLETFQGWRERNRLKQPPDVNKIRFLTVRRLGNSSHAKLTGF